MIVSTNIIFQLIYLIKWKTLRERYTNFKFFLSVFSQDSMCDFLFRQEPGIYLSTSFPKKLDILAWNCFLIYMFRCSPVLKRDSISFPNLHLLSTYSYFFLHLVPRYQLLILYLWITRNIQNLLIWKLEEDFLL